MALEDDELDGIDETEETEGSAKKGNATMKIVLIVNAVLLLIAISVGLTYFLMSGDEPIAKVDSEADVEVLDNEPAAEDEALVERKPASSKHIYIPLKPAFVVNFENPEQVSLLQVDIQLMTYDPAVEKALNTHMPRIRNELLLLFGGKQYHEINTREGKRKLSQDAIMEIQRVLQEEGAPSSVEALYFTSFVMQ
ncbi:MAG: flagellar basal body-associated FliL family protein [Gammaproteobacteria bacterium]|nr:flagellar basal body-associated FliL family protein [Gammaproteobacteria bacterium]MCW8910122.1 flagellar basal body-associated FliL family protein [Gammaproteobacteria bacterium]MCW9005251.1 flagellar basal body-associated FliL family protein [Gammaproteobacteria bacterium]